MSYDIEQPAITEFRLQITSMLFLSSAISSTSLMDQSTAEQTRSSPDPDPDYYKNKLQHKIIIISSGLRRAGSTRDMFQTQARTERYDDTKAFNECKMVRGTSVSDHVMKMKRHMDHLERLGHPVPLQLATDTILNSLSEDYKPFCDQLQHE
ncbi:hypothetical protein OSB04_006968 [Centaurea solstitialis]|uniref:Uncharacterized protein n=1 Tax=Centaurea solstitialis TaxID=347529 RepID=A0AA38TIY4_9ASTR|nr:hypothetical protein OSB04_006968 [Centaurea solstitialis]